MNITVFLGANMGEDQMYVFEAKSLGKWIGENGHKLVYGGSKIGLMGVLADAVLEHKGQVIGVEPTFFLEQKMQHDRLTELIETETIEERRAKMIELGDAFIAFPGGTGTLEEISEIMSKIVLGHLHAPCIIYNLNGYYDDLRRLLDRMVETELASEELLKGIRFAGSLREMTEIIEGT